MYKVDYPYMKLQKIYKSRDLLLVNNRKC